MTRRRTPVWTPSDDQMGHWPAVSGNAINGVGEDAPRRPSPIYWHPPDDPMGRCSDGSISARGTMRRLPKRGATASGR